MSEQVIVTRGEKIKRGGILVSSDATIEYPETEKKEKPTPLVKYQCPDRCLQPEDPDQPNLKRKVAHIWVQRGQHERYARLLECPNCQARLVFVPGKHERE